MACALAGGLLLSSCSSEEGGIEIPEGKGAVRLSLTTDAGFGVNTKAVDEAPYKELSNYKIQLMSGDDVLKTYSYDELKDNAIISYPNGTYSMRAYYGTDAPASTTGMYVYGEAPFTIKNDTATVSLECKPVCAKVTVTFDKAMDTYFSDYSVAFNSKALGEATFTWGKSATDPVYMRVEEKEKVNATINLSVKDGYKVQSTSVPVTYTMSPATLKNISIKPNMAQGSLGLTITINEETTDKEINIEIPNDWVSE